MTCMVIWSYVGNPWDFPYWIRSKPYDIYQSWDSKNPRFPSQILDLGWEHLLMNIHQQVVVVTVFTVTTTRPICIPTYGPYRYITEHVMLSTLVHIMSTLILYSVWCWKGVCKYKTGKVGSLAGCEIWYRNLGLQSGTFGRLVQTYSVI